MVCEVPLPSFLPSATCFLLSFSYLGGAGSQIHNRFTSVALPRVGDKSLNFQIPFAFPNASFLSLIHSIFYCSSAVVRFK